MITNVQEATKEDVNMAVTAAREAFDNGPWSSMSGKERGMLMNNLVMLLERHKEELADLESLDSGKPFNMTSTVDIPAMIDTFRYYGGMADKIHGLTVPMDVPFLNCSQSEPVGVCG